MTPRTESQCPCGFKIAKDKVISEKKMTSKIQTLVFDSVNKRFERHMQEVESWCVVSKVAKNEQAVVVALGLSYNDASGVKDKLFNRLELGDFRSDTGVAKFKVLMDGFFKNDDISEMYEPLVEFIRFRRGDKQSIGDYILV